MTSISSQPKDPPMNEDRSGDKGRRAANNEGCPAVPRLVILPIDPPARRTGWGPRAGAIRRGAGGG